MIILKEKPSFDIRDIYTDNVIFMFALKNRRQYEGRAPRDVINGILKGNFDTSPENYYASLMIALKSAHGSHLAVRSLSVVKRMLTFKVPNYHAGFALKQMKGTSGFSEIVAVHNCSGFEDIGKALMDQAIRKGGKYLECFGGFLHDYYTQRGFEVYRKIPNTKMPNGILETLYFMKLKSASTPKY